MKHIRHEQILRLLSTQKTVTINALIDTLHTSIETIRRDLKDLEEQGLLKRVYGGATAVNATGAEPAYARRAVLNLEEKKAIARKAAELVSDGDTLVLDLGTTTLEVARALTAKNLTVLTNSLNAAQVLVMEPSHKVYVLGGLLRGVENALSGSLCLQGLNNFRVDKAIIGVGGISVKDGITDFHEAEAQARRLMIDISGQVIAVADFSKFGVAAFYKICALDHVNTLITDWNTPKQTLLAFKDYRLHIHVASR
jgi:DeoR/GlpR family transcriptional regulator of sugar metabolism